MSIDTTPLEILLKSINDTIMALASGQIAIPIAFPTNQNVTVTNTALPISGTVTALPPQISTTGESTIAVTLVSQGLGTIPVNTKGAQIQFLSNNGNDRLYTRTDGNAATANDAQTTALQLIELESLIDVQNFRFIGTTGTNIKVIFRN